MADLGSPEWVEALDASLRAVDGGGASTVEPFVVQHEVVGGAAWYVTVASGRAGAAPGRAAHADVTMRWQPDAAAAVHAGRLSALVAFGDGRLHVRGDVGSLSRVAPLLASLARAGG